MLYLCCRQNSRSIGFLPRGSNDAYCMTISGKAQAGQEARAETKHRRSQYSKKPMAALYGMLYHILIRRIALTPQKNKYDNVQHTPNWYECASLPHQLAACA